MPRFYILLPGGDEVILTGEDANHIGRSLRMRPGETLTLCDGQGYDYPAVIKSITNDAVYVSLGEKTKTKTEPSVSLKLYQALPKSDKMDFIVQKAVELGVDEIIPVLTSRCISRPDEKTIPKKTARWQKIAGEAAKQCGRGIIPTVQPCISFAAAIREFAALPLPLFFYEKGGENLQSVLSKDYSSIGIFIGAEGGFSPEEAAAAQKAGAVIAGLGPRILRCETAPLVAITAVMYQSGNLSG